MNRVLGTLAVGILAGVLGCNGPEVGSNGNGKPRGAYEHVPPTYLAPSQRADYFGAAGDWATYQVSEQRWTYTVLAASDSIFAFRVEAPADTSETSFRFTGPEVADEGPADGTRTETGEETVTAAGRELRCRTVAVFDAVTGEAMSKSWKSPDVPVEGIVRSEVMGYVQFELLELGKKAPEP